MAFALQEAKVVMAMLLHRFKFVYGKEDSNLVICILIGGDY